MARKNEAPDTTDGGSAPGDTQTVERSRITIGGQEFDVSSPYTEGHALTKSESRALNQLLHENLRNNFSKKVKEGMSSGKSRDDLQAELDQYASTYTFEARRVGGPGRTADPVAREAKVLAKNAIIANLKKQGKDPKNYSSEQMLAAIEKTAKRDDIMALARKRVEEQQSLAGDAIAELEPAA